MAVTLAPKHRSCTRRSPKQGEEASGACAAAKRPRVHSRALAEQRWLEAARDQLMWAPSALRCAHQPDEHSRKLEVL